MDLRAGLKGDEIDEAVEYLDYQPFVLTDDLQTGIAYSFVIDADPRTAPPTLFRRGDYSSSQWGLISEANGQLRAMYDDLLDEVAGRYPGGSLLDLACNNGYFPVGASLRKMRALGLDMGDYSQSVRILNNAVGASAEFRNLTYDSTSHTLPLQERYDVTVMSAIMCHLPDPLNFLAAAASVTNEAILFWGQVVDSDGMIVVYNKPHPSLSKLTTFPHNFNDGTRLSRGLLYASLEMLGFKNILEIPHKSTWLSQFMPKSFEKNPPEISR